MTALRVGEARGFYNLYTIMPISLEYAAAAAAVDVCIMPSYIRLSLSSAPKASCTTERECICIPVPRRKNVYTSCCATLVSAYTYTCSLTRGEGAALEPTT